MDKVRERVWLGLQAVMLNGQYASLWMRNNLNGLSRDQRRWVTQVLYGVLRYREPVRYQWSDLVRRPPADRIALLLDMSVYQLFWLDQSADYAVVNEMVQLCPKAQKGLVNAVLHRVIARGRRPQPESDAMEDLALRTSHPQWLLKMWAAQYSPETMRRIALADLQPGSVAVRINPLKLSAEQLAQRPEVTLDENGWTLKMTGNPLHDPWFEQGRIVVQDPSSQQAALWLDPKPGERVLDVCSAPGTKTTQMAAMMNNRGTILACDLYEHRLRLVEQAAQKQGATIITTRQMDALKADQMLAADQFDKVLMDVPCSGLGVLRHKPEILCHLRPEDLDQIILLQRQILDHVSGLVKPGGSFVYSTCTLNRKENEKQIEAFLRDHPDFSLVRQQTRFPFEADQDGFYIAKVIRKP